MKEIERKIIDLIKTSQTELVLSCFDQIHKEIEKKGFGYCSPEFINHDSVLSYISSLEDYEALGLWYSIECYIANSGNEELQLKTIFEIGTIIKDTLKSKNIELGDRKALSDPTLIRNVYMSGDERLIKYFMNVVPIPKHNVFYGYDFPPFIAKHQQDATKAILTTPLLEKTIIIAQRNFRARERRKKEIARVTKIIKKSRRPEIFDLDGKTEKNAAISLLDDANKPYMPRGCSEELAKRIFEASKKVKLFDSISHMTSVRALPSILNDGLYGRQTLEAFNMDYKDAVLNGRDVEDGDYNVICFGPQKIEKSKLQDLVQIKLNYKKLQKANPCIFYKQKDLGYMVSGYREVPLGTDILKFGHTNPVGRIDKECSDVFIEFSGLEGYAELPKFLFIAYDVPNIHQILTLNFFRFIDRLRASLHAMTINPELTKSIYDRIDKLSPENDDEQLVAFLETMGKNFSDTAELNFYGAHKLNISIIQTFTFEDYTLDLPKFIIDLNAGDHEQLKLATNIIPELFKSYNMIDYLLSKVTHPNIRIQLESIRNDCVIPLWKMAKEKGLTASDDLADLQQKYIEKGKTIRENRENKGGDEEEECKRQAALAGERRKKNLS